MAIDNNIESKAKKLIEESGVKNVYPVPLVPIADFLGYKIIEFIPDNEEKKKISGAVYYEDCKILVNSQESSRRKRFTIAHEIGHINLDDGDKNYIDYRDPSEETKNDPKETAANAFAAALLMPKNEFVRRLGLYNNYYETAEYFQVSPDAARYRAINLDRPL